jgi:predicted small lipoprotein YifL
MLKKFVIAVALAVVAGTVAACGSAGPTTFEEVNSAVPPLTPDLEGHLERRFRDANKVTGLRCRQLRLESIALTTWECVGTTVPAGGHVEVDLLVNGFDGSYEIFECRTRPNQPYSQAPRGACKSIH